VADMVGRAAVPCILILIGASLYPFPGIHGKRDLAYLVFVRLFLLPLLFVSVLWMLPVAQDVRNIALVVALMPASVSSTILTRRYGGDPDFAARSAVVTTIASILTVPAWLYLLQRLG
jgi:predicted permease